jgi:hypothetical protein
MGGATMMGVVAQPWWVNLAILVPLAAYWSWRNGGVAISARQLAVAGVFAVAFGFVEASVVVYLRAASGLLPGYQGTLSDVMRLSGTYYQQAQAVKELPKSLITIEALREAATMFMLVSVALLCSRKTRSRWAIFLWMFAIWDIVYYAALWGTVRWPGSLKELDVLFLLPVPWIAPVWFPVVVSALTILAVLFRRAAVIEN